MFEECKNLRRTLWAICLLVSPFTGLALFVWIVAGDGLKFRNHWALIVTSAVVSAFVFTIFHGVAAVFVRRGALWAAQASMVLAGIWILIGLAIVVASLVDPNPLCLIGLVVSIGGGSGLNIASNAIAEIKADDGWNRDGPLRDSKGFAVVTKDAPHPHPNPLPKGAGTKPHPTVSDRGK